MAKRPTRQTMTFAEYARHQNVAYQTVRKWSEQDRIKRAGQGLVDVQASDAMLVEARGADVGKPGRPKAAGPTDASAIYSSSEAQRVKDNYVAMQKKLEFEKDAGRLAEVEVLAEVMAAQGAALRAKLLAFGSALGPRVAMLKSPEQCTAIIDTEMVRILEEIVADARRAREALEVAAR